MKEADLDSGHENFSGAGDGGRAASAKLCLNF
jgi:hypothetical protein